jgi:acyl-CoA reductase-like NAD-dependent aldehyde dehydrogenase
VVDQRQLASNLKYIDIARAEGGLVAFGGEAADARRAGFSSSRP